MREPEGSLITQQAPSIYIWTKQNAPVMELGFGVPLTHPGLPSASVNFCYVINHPKMSRFKIAAIPLAHDSAGSLNWAQQGSSRLAHFAQAFVVYGWCLLVYQD